MNIEFEKIPTSIRHPGVYTEYNTKGAVSSLPTNEQEVLILAPMTKSGVEKYSAPLRVYSDIDAAETFGYGSWAHLMTRQAIRNNSLIRLTVVGLADNESGVAATGSVVIDGTASSAGVLTVSIANEDFKISVTNGEGSASCASRMAALINGTRDSTVVAELSGSTINLTAKCKGEIGNGISLGYRNTASGLSINLTALSGGQENAEIADALTSVAGEHYHIIISPFTDIANAKALSAHLESVSSPIEKKPAIGVLAWTGTMSSGSDFTEQLNDGRLTCAWYKGASDNAAIIAAGYGAVIASEEDPARPLNTLEIKGLTLVDVTQMPLFGELNQALFHGLTPLKIVNSKVQILRAISTYTKSATNTDDPSLLDLTTIRTLDYTRKAIEQRIALRFPRSKLSNRTPEKVKSEILDVLLKLDDEEILENVKANKGKLIVQRNSIDVNRLDTQIPADVVNGLHVVANRIDLIL